MEHSRSVTVTITPGTIAAVILSLILVGLLFYLRDLVFVVLTAIVIASSMEPAVLFFKKIGLPRVLGVLLIYALIALALFGLVYFIFPPLLHQASGFLSLLPEYVKTFHLPAEAQQGLLLFGVDTAASSTNPLNSAVLSLKDTLAPSSVGALHAVGAVFGGIISFTLIIVLSFYFAVQDTGIDDFLRLISPVSKHNYLVNLWRRAQHKIGRWMQGQLILSCIIFVLLFIGLSFFKVRYALLLALVAALFELVPVFGSIMAAIPAVAVALVDGGTTLALLTVLLYLVVNQLQANIVHPLVVQKVVGVPPLMVILAIIAGGQIAGFLGIILSVPVAAAVREYVADIQRGKHKRHEEIAAAGNST